MKFVVDAHLPRQVAIFLQQAGFDALHTLDLISQQFGHDQRLSNICCTAALTHKPQTFARPTSAR